MAEKKELATETRTALGTHASRRLRKDGIIPVTLLQRSDKPLHLQSREREIIKLLKTGARVFTLKHPGGSENVFLKEVQWDHLGEKIYHIDFTKVAADELLNLEVELVLKGKPVGVVEEEGTLDHYLKTVQISCKPDAIPEKIEVKVEHLKLNDNLTIGDITPPPGVELKQSADMVVAAVTEHKEEEVAPAEVEPGAVEPEVIEKETTEEEPTEEK